MSQENHTKGPDTEVCDLVATVTAGDDMDAFLETQQRLTPAERAVIIRLEAGDRSMETIERWISFFYNTCDAHVAREGADAYTPQTIVIVSSFEWPDIFRGLQGLQWEQVE